MLADRKGGMSKTIFKLWSIRCMNDLGSAQTYSRITTQPLQGHLAVIEEYHHQVLKVFLHIHRLRGLVPALEPQHNANHEAVQAIIRSFFHHEYLIQQFAYLKDIASLRICQQDAVKWLTGYSTAFLKNVFIKDYQSQQSLLRFVEILFQKSLTNSKNLL